MKALILLADGFEEIEAFTVTNVLRRANIDISTVSLATSIVTGRHKVKAVADKRIDEIDPYSFDMLILPSSQKLLNSGRAIELVKNFNKKGKLIAAINFAPLMLAQAGILDDKVATICPGLENKIPKPRDAKVVVAKNVITGRGPAAAMDFALKLAEIMAGKPAALKVKRSLAFDAQS